MRFVAIVVLLIAATMQVVAGDVRVLIAPRSVVVPRSGKLVVDIYWINRGSRPAVIPGEGLHSFVYAPLDVDASWAGSEMHVFSHKPPDRRILARAIVRETTTVEMDTRGVKVLEISGRFLGHRVKFESNSVIVRTTR